MRFVPLALLLSLSPLPLMAHEAHGAAALGVTVEGVPTTVLQQPQPAAQR